MGRRSSRPNRRVPALVQVISRRPLKSAGAPSPCGRTGGANSRWSGADRPVETCWCRWRASSGTNSRPPPGRAVRQNWPAPRSGGAPPARCGHADIVLSAPPGSVQETRGIVRAPAAGCREISPSSCTLTSVGSQSFSCAKPQAIALMNVGFTRSRGRCGMQRTSTPGLRGDRTPAGSDKNGFQVLASVDVASVYRFSAA